jgi:hypothetical protein
MPDEIDRQNIAILPLSKKASQMLAVTILQNSYKCLKGDLSNMKKCKASITDKAISLVKLIAHFFYAAFIR